MKQPVFYTKFRTALRFLLAAGLIFPAAFVFAGQKADGVVLAGEYESSVVLDDGKVIVSWNLASENLEAAISANTAGWVSIGFDPVDVMDGADMVIGWVNTDGAATILDCFATGSFGPHPADTDLGGKDALTARSGSQKDGITTIEFSRPRTAGDDFDKAVGPVTNFIWAYSETDGFNDYHIKAGYGVLEATGDSGASKAGELSKTTRNRVLALIVPHALPLVLSFICMLAGMLVARYGKKNKKWLSIHKPLGYSAAGLALIGLAMGVRLVLATSGIHFRVPHAFLGAFTLLSVFATPALGRAMFVFKKKAKLLRKLHRIFGRIAIICMALTIFSGLILAGIIKF